MAQAVFIATEVSVSTVSRKPAMMADDNKAQAFADELNRLVDDKPSAQTQAKKEPAAANAAETEKTTEGDGNNLPDEDKKATSNTDDETPVVSEHEDNAKDHQSALELIAQPQEADLKQMDSSKKAPEKEATTAKVSAEVVKNLPVKEADSAATEIISSTGDKAMSSDKAVSSQPLKEPSSPQPLSLRADILNALNKPQQKTAVQPVQTNARNMLAEQVTKQQTETSVAKLVNPVLSLLENTAAERPTTSSSLLPPATNLAAPALTGTGVQPATANVPTLTIQPNLQQAAWGQVMSNRVVWMAKEGVQQTEIKLNPANMGPVEVRLHIHNDQANVTFLAQHAATRDALEQAMPRLRESFAEAGLQLGNAEVGQQSSQQHDQSENNGSSHIFSQADAIFVDTDTETDQQIQSDEVAAGLSLYA